MLKLNAFDFINRPAGENLALKIDLSRPLHLSSWPEGQVRIAFDGDGVLFSDEAENIFQTKGLIAFQESEQDKSHIPLPSGPMQAFAMKLQNVRRALGDSNEWRIRTFLITARDHAVTKRVFNTLKEWKLQIDEKHFLGGLDKTPFLRAIDPTIFFDDSIEHIERAKQCVPAAHVIYGSKNTSSVVSELVPAAVLPVKDEN